MIDHALVKCIQYCIILQLTVTKRQKQLVAFAGQLLIDGIIQIVQVLADRTGSCFLENLIIFKNFILGKRKKCPSFLHLDLLFSVHIAAADIINGIAILFELLADL